MSKLAGVLIAIYIALVVLVTWMALSHPAKTKPQPHIQNLDFSECVLYVDSDRVSDTRLYICPDGQVYAVNTGEKRPIGGATKVPPTPKD